MPNPFNFKEIRSEQYILSPDSKRVVIELDFDWDSQIHFKVPAGTISNFIAKGTVMLELLCDDSNISTRNKIGMVNFRNKKTLYKSAFLGTKNWTQPNAPFFSTTAILVFERFFCTWQLKRRR